jgi:hypothetical protein
MSAPSRSSKSKAQNPSCYILYSPMLQGSRPIKLNFPVRRKIHHLRVVYTMSINTSFWESGFETRASTTVYMWLRAKHILKSHTCKVNPWKYTETVQQNTENRKIELSHSYPKPETAHSNTQATNYICHREHLLISLYLWGGGSRAQSRLRWHQKLSMCLIRHHTMKMGEGRNSSTYCDDTWQPEEIICCVIMASKQHMTTGFHGNGYARNNTRDCWKWCFLLGPPRGYIMRANGTT